MKSLVMWNIKMEPQYHTIKRGEHSSLRCLFALGQHGAFIPSPLMVSLVAPFMLPYLGITSVTLGIVSEPPERRTKTAVVDQS